MARRPQARAFPGIAPGWRPAASPASGRALLRLALAVVMAARAERVVCPTGLCWGSDQDRRVAAGRDRRGGGARIRLLLPGWISPCFRARGMGADSSPGRVGGRGSRPPPAGCGFSPRHVDVPDPAGGVGYMAMDRRGPKVLEPRRAPHPYAIFVTIHATSGIAALRCNGDVRYSRIYTPVQCARSGCRRSDHRLAAPSRARSTRRLRGQRGHAVRGTP
jgi:hypothetical protein